MLVIWERFLRFKVFYCLTGGEAKFQKGKGSDTRERSDLAMSTVIFSVVIISSTSEE